MTNEKHFAYTAFATKGQVYGYAELICKTADDVAFLPTDEHTLAVGSKCYCIGTGETYILDVDRNWTSTVVDSSHDQVAPGGGAEEEPDQIDKY